MDIILLVNSWNPSSIEKMHCMAKAMTSTTISVRVLSLCHEHQDVCAFYEKFTPQEDYVFLKGSEGSLWKGNSKIGKFFNNLKISLNFGRLLFRHILKKKPDTIILPQGVLEMNIPAILLGKLFRIPVIGNIMEFKPAFASYVNLNSRLEWWLISSCCDAYFLISHFLMEHFGQVQDRMCLPVLIDTLDGSNFCDEIEKLQDPPLLLYTNSPAYTDLLFFCIDALKYVHTEYKLVITGNYKNQEKIKKHIQSCGLEQKVSFSGFITDIEMKNFYRRSIALLVPLIDDIQHKARFPQKILQYMLYEKPVVTSNVGEIPYFFEDNVSVLIDSTNSPKGFGRKVSKILENHESAIRIGKNGAQTVHELFSTTVWGERIHTFIKQLDANE